MEKEKILGKKERILTSEAYLVGRSVVIPTDTIYGITALALDKKAVARLYRIRKRDLNKPFIILISSFKDLLLFGVDIKKEQRVWLSRFWPGKLTAILPCDGVEFKYLHRGKKSLAFRLPDNKWLLQLITEVGPIIAPSANLQGGKPAETIEDAYNYFNGRVEYVDVGRLKGSPSTIVSFEDGFKIIRQGSLKIKKNEYFRSDINN